MAVNCCQVSYVIQLERVGCWCLCFAERGVIGDAFRFLDEFEE